MLKRVEGRPDGLGPSDVAAAFEQAGAKRVHATPTRRQGVVAVYCEVQRRKMLFLVEPHWDERLAQTVADEIRARS